MWLLLAQNAIAQPTRTVTTEVLDESGARTTFVKEARTGRYLKMITGPITTDFLYDSECKPGDPTPCSLEHTGESVHVNGLTLTERYTRNGKLAVEGLPAIAEHETNRDGRDIVIRTTGGTVLARYAYTDAGRLREVTIGDAGRLTISETTGNVVTETLYDNHDQKLRETEARLDKPAANMQAGLDPIALALGLPRDWPFSYTYRGGAVVSTVKDPHGAIVAYVLNGGAVFDAHGKPLLYDIQVNLSKDLTKSDDLNPDATTSVLQRVAPTHLVLARDGSIGIYVESAGEQAIYSIWTKKESPLAYRIAP